MAAGLTTVLKLAWGCRPIIMLASTQKAVAVKAYHYNLWHCRVSMGRSSEKAFGVSIRQEGNRGVRSNTGKDLENMLALIWERNHCRSYHCTYVSM